MREREEEEEDPAGFARERLETPHTEMLIAARVGEEQEQSLRREKRKRGRFKGSLEELKTMRSALLSIIVTGRRQRLHERERTRPAPKAAPHGVRLPQKAISEMTIQELRSKVAQEEDRVAQHQGGAYVSPPVPNLQQYKDRIDILETQAQEEVDRMEELRALERRVQQQEEEHRQAVLEARRLAAELAENEKLRPDQEELDRQATSTEVPEEQVQVAEQVLIVPPMIGEENGEHSEPQTVESSTTTSNSTGASTRAYNRERRDSENYWNNIIEIMYAYFHDEHLIRNVQSLHEGVLFWWEEDDIKDLEQRAKGDNDPEATEEYTKYLEENDQLETTLRQDHERANGKLEDVEEYKQALEDKDSEKLKEIIYQYAKDIRERKLAWKDRKIIEENKRKDKYKRQLLQEQGEERLKKQKMSCFQVHGPLFCWQPGFSQNGLVHNVEADACLGLLTP
eukprot:5140710-Amphidinium_carterae.2